MAKKLTATQLIASGAVRVTKVEGKEYRDDTKVWLGRGSWMQALHRQVIKDAPPKWLAPVTPVSQMTEKQRLAELDRQVRRLSWHEGLLPSEVVPAGVELA